MGACPKYNHAVDAYICLAADELTSSTHNTLKIKTTSTERGVCSVSHVPLNT